MKKVLSEMDAFMYCGHGSSLKNFSSQEIEKLNARAVPLLFGCNSGKLERYGRKLDPMGMFFRSQWAKSGNSAIKNVC